MLMESKIKIYEQGLEEYPKPNIILGNFLMLLWIALGTLACWIFLPIIAWLYLAFAILMIGFILRKLLCTNCYYYDKWCTLGWGKFSALFFKKGNTEKFSENFGQKLAPLTYGIIGLVPIILIVISTVQKFSLLKMIVLIFLFLISFYSGIISRRKNCSQCKMRLICKGCAARPQ